MFVEDVFGMFMNIVSGEESLLGNFFKLGDVDKVVIMVYVVLFMVDMSEGYMGSDDKKFVSKIIFCYFLLFRKSMYYVMKKDCGLF